MEKVQVATLEEWFCALVNSETTHLLYGSDCTSERSAAALSTHAKTVEAIRAAIDAARAEGARAALAGVPEVVREAVEAGMPTGFSDEDRATLAAWLRFLPPHDATGSQGVES